MDSARDDAELKALIERLTLLKELENARKLSLGADVTDKGLRLLWAFPSLTALTLSSTQLTNTGLKALTNLPQLNEVKIFHAPITDKGLKHFAEIPNLKWLSIGASKVTAHGIKELQALRPKLKILY